MITFYVPSRKLLGVSHIPLLYPFWGNPLTERTPFNKELFSKYSFDTKLYRVTDRITGADFVLIPYRHNVLIPKYREAYRSYLGEARAAGKPILLDGTADIEIPVPEEDVYVLRVGGYRSKNTGREIIIPPYADDLLESYCGGKLSLREKADVPTIGFAGWGSVHGLARAKAVVRDIPVRIGALFSPGLGARRKGVLIRERALSVLQGTKGLKTNFLPRPSYSAHADTASGDMARLRREFVENILVSDYVLDVRGDANASTRLFETLSLGRVPIIIDTDRNFPFREDLKYSDFSLSVDFRDLEHLGERVTDFHRGISADRFTDMQARAREAYRNYFRVDALTGHLMRALGDVLKTYHGEQ